MFEDIFEKLEKDNNFFKKNSKISMYAYFINHRLIIESYAKIINYISGEVTQDYFNNSYETKNYFKNVYYDLYHYKNNSGKVNIKNTIKILKWYYGETKNYKKLKELIENLYNARNKINHTDELIFKSFLSLSI